MDPDSLAKLYLDVSSDHEFSVTFTYDDGTGQDTLEKVGFRLRGNTSRYSAKKSFKVSFNTFEPGRTYHDAEKINLNGSHNDPSMVREKLYYDAWNQFGLPARRCSFVRLYINNEYYGLYTNLEEIDEIWCKDRFGDNSGNLYKCTYPVDLAYHGPEQEDYKSIESATVTGGRAYDLQNNTANDDYSDLVNLITVLHQTPVSELPCELEKVFDVDAFLRAYAVDVSTGNWDDYAFNKNNFFLYHNAFTNQIEFIAYDCDNTFGVDWFGIDWTARSIYDWKNASLDVPLVNQILQVPEYKNRYSFYINQLENTILFPANTAPHVDSMKNLITAAAVEDLYRTYDYGYTVDDFFNSFTTNGIDGHTPYGINNFIEARETSTQSQVVLTNIAPVIRDEQRLPAPVAAGDSIEITVTVFDDAVVNAVNIFYSFDSLSFLSATMFDDGMHHDLLAGDKIYGAVLPPSGNNGHVYYHIESSDNNSLMSRVPICGDFTLNIGFAAPQLFINEFLASNSTVIADNANEYDDYVELYNAGSTPIYLADKYLSDDFNNPSKWQLPHITLEADHYILLWTDGDPQQGNFHAGFSLNAEGERIGLYAGVTDYFAAIDTFIFDQQFPDISMGRLPNGTGPFVMLPGPTPGFNNYSVGIEEAPSGANSLMVLSDPLSNETTVKLSLKENASVVMKLYSVQGVMLKEMNLTVLEKGAHYFPVNTTLFPPGMYFIIAIINGDAEIKKLLIQ